MPANAETEQTCRTECAQRESPRARALVAKDCSEAADNDVETVMKVDRPVRPQPALDLFTSNQLAWPLEQKTEHIERLSAELHRLPARPQAPSALVKLEVSE